jgi:hypothetical protein
MGLGGFALALMGCHVTSTDLAPVLPLLRRNHELNLSPAALKREGGGQRVRVVVVAGVRVVVVVVVCVCIRGKGGGRGSSAAAACVDRGEVAEGSVPQPTQPALGYLCPTGRSGSPGKLLHA